MQYLSKQTALVCHHYVLHVAAFVGGISNTQSLHFRSGFHSELIYLLSNVNQDECANLFKIVQLLAIKITNFAPSRIGQ